ncbi:MAG: UDP-N-acetylglucosamine--N-acetylmuramyl-(pentapeptide) pyrophosphoryl-undecaprenol N-acetylglucosamine transferase [Marinicaulis sp.]|nr:UDP-N-acetylglucosamine--N-acetylmuramyl-(pentapeptide) pyrophosphoryl-undecaprenol N-acetylglucosamine transferase [Marinicaulis sp.]NNE39857.1 UDP-N-acetylglucosamine--N-acetylmuramyl-(pentapeptide) pyrophosphoryl-undecaprenol N-acetylglucosamine transferase [Marinicaulis sp.]NNL88307.1 UDP-N-acetylglucosamine--N-acetylmuramyl-(pentapeptide) pyrophosphoryl-undecaprenol N-acetylglucosamine transferase [Marinicaulis sp.]
MTGLIALAAGGTGGHMFPAEALAQELKRRGYEILLVTDARGERFASDFPADERLLISAGTPSIGGPIAKVAAAASIAKGIFTTISAFKKNRPVMAVGFGGYPSLPAMKAAALLNIPYGVHEQNGVLGRANRMLAKGAQFTAHAFPTLEKLPPGVEKIEVGNPIRDAVREQADVEFQSVADGGEIRVLIFGGSQGASIFSDAPAKAIAARREEFRSRLRIVHQVREDDIERVKALYRDANVSAEVAPFFKDLPARIAAAHLIISRAGASTVTELSTIGRGSILTPLAIAMDDHQTVNARVLSEANAAILLPEAKFNEESLGTILSTLFANPARLEAMAAAAKGVVQTDAASRVADLVDHIAGARAAA